MHEMSTKRDQVVWDKTGQWLPSPKDETAAVWRKDSLAFTLPDIARKWVGFSVYVLGSKGWLHAYQSNDFLNEISKLGMDTDATFNGAQQGGIVSELKWGDKGTICFKFWSSEKMQSLITEKVINEPDHPQVIYIKGTRCESAIHLDNSR
jgi:hypothetical protein